MGDPNRPDGNALFQVSTGMGDGEIRELNSGKTESGRDFKSYVFAGDMAVDLNGPPEVVAAAIAAGAPAGEQDVIRAGMAIGSQQAPVDRTRKGIYVREAKVLIPEYAPDTLMGIYHDDPDYRTAIDTRCDAVLGLGLEIQQRPHVNEPSQEERDKLIEWLRNASGDESLSTEMRAAYRDEQVVGTGYMEVVRDPEANTEDSLRSINYARSLITRMGCDRQHFYQLHMDKAMVFRRLGRHDDTPYALCLKLDKKKLANHKKGDWRIVDQWLTSDQHRDAVKLQAERGSVPLELAGIQQTKSCGTIEEGALLRATNEITHMRIPAMNDSTYGVPAIVNGVRDWAAARYVREMNLNYFDNNTIPPLLVTVTGERLPADTVTNIRDALVRNRGRQAFHKAVYLELPHGCEMKLEPLSKLLQEDAGFMEYLDFLSTSMHRIARTPRSMTEVLKDANQGVVDNAMRWFSQLTVKPDQLRWSHRLNWILERYLGINDWFVSLGAMSLEDELTRAEIDEKRLRGAVYSPNDVLRRLGMPDKVGGEYATKTIPGVGVILLEAVKVISERVIGGESVREVLAPKGHDTPSSEAPLAKPAAGPKSGLASADYMLPDEEDEA